MKFKFLLTVRLKSKYVRGRIKNVSRKKYEPFFCLTHIQIQYPYLKFNVPPFNQTSLHSNSFTYFICFYLSKKCCLMSKCWFIGASQHALNFSGSQKVSELERLMWLFVARLFLLPKFGSRRCFLDDPGFILGGLNRGCKIPGLVDRCTIPPTSSLLLWGKQGM